MKKTPTGMIVGFIFIVLGILYAGSALDIFEFSIFFPGFWTLFIIVPCFYAMFKKGQDKTGPIIGLVIGFCFLINAQNISLHIDFWPMILAALCLVIGARLLFPNKTPLFGSQSKNVSLNSQPGQGAADAYSDGTGFGGSHHSNGSGYINASSIFSGKEIRLDNEVFCGANLTSIFGGLELDLSNAVITEDVRVNVSAVFGGIDIYIPSNVWINTNNVTPLFGGVEVSADGYGSSNETFHTIYFTGSCIFGGVEIH